MQRWVLIETLVQSKGEEEDDEAAYSGYAAAFAKLHNAAAPRQDPLPEIQDTGRYFAESLAQLARVSFTFLLCRFFTSVLC